jgi:hypothetical protein
MKSIITLSFLGQKYITYNISIYIPIFTRLDQIFSYKSNIYNFDGKLIGVISGPDITPAYKKEYEPAYLKFECFYHQARGIGDKIMTPNLIKLMIRGAYCSNILIVSDFLETPNNLHSIKAGCQRFQIFYTYTVDLKFKGYKGTCSRQEMKNLSNSNIKIDIIESIKE